MPVPDRLRIGVLFMQSQSFFGADSRVHAELMAALDKEEFDVHVACNAGTATEPSAALVAMQRIEGITVRPTHFGPTLTGVGRWAVLRETLRRGPEAVASLFGLARYARRQKVRVVHGTEKPRDAVYGYLIARAAGATCIVHVHVKAETWINRVTRWVMHHSQIIAITHFVEDSIVALGYDRARIETIHNGMDLRRWDPQLVDGSAVRAEFGFQPETPVLAIVARLFYWKGHLALLDALALVAARRPDVRLLVVGEDDPRGAPGRDSMTAEMRRSIATLGLAEQVIFTGFRSDVPQVMAASDIFAMPSYEEPFGMVFLEAMALERPVVALDNGGTPEVVVHGETGLLSPPGDDQQFAEHLLRLIEDPARRVTMGQAGRRRAIEVFTPAAMAEATARLYRRLAGRPSGGGAAAPDAPSKEGST
jgi:glycosyltransferase involved in cell wall biosynthesis